ncbi:hypothetical protein CF319_g7770 [Tilletia indica]|nr:hypothetical protein CF319_g7770 [Tilletia indica]
MEGSFSSSFVGIIQVDKCTRRGTSNFYDLELQLMTQMPCGEELDSCQVEIRGQVYRESGPLEEDPVAWASGTFLGLAVGFLDINSFGTLFEGAAPDNFDPAPGTVMLVGQVVSKTDDGKAFTMRVVDYDRRSNTRRPAEWLIRRLGQRWANVQPPRVGSVVSARGTLYDHSPVSQMYSISLDAVNYINVATTETSSAPNSPKKRKFVRRNDGKGKEKEGDNGPPPPGDNNGEGPSGTGEGPPPAGDGPSTPTAGLNARNRQRGK